MRFAALIAAMFSLCVGTGQAQDTLKLQFEENQALLESVRKDISISSQAEAALAEQIATLEADGAKLNDELVKSSSRSRQLALKAQRTARRVLSLENEKQELLQVLRSKRALLAEVLGALQRIGNNPPPALLVTPKDALVSIRSAILLGSVVPGMRSESQILANQLQELTRLVDNIASLRAQLAQDIKLESEEENRLALLVKQKRKRVNQARGELATQSLEAAKLAAKATNLSTFISQLQSQIKIADEATLAALAKSERTRLKQNARIASARKEVLRPDFSDTSRISPAVSFPDAKGHLIKPVNGVEIRKFGTRDDIGDLSSSIAIATRINERVISPADGWVVYSGKFRSYGQMLILDVGAKHHIVMSGMERTDVVLGQFVLVGEPVGIMGERRIASAGTLDIGLTRPVLEIEIRNGNEPIDPAPWWQANTDKRSNNDS